MTIVTMLQHTKVILHVSYFTSKYGCVYNHLFNLFNLMDVNESFKKMFLKICDCQSTIGQICDKTKQCIFQLNPSLDPCVMLKFSDGIAV